MEEGESVSGEPFWLENRWKNSPGNNDDKLLTGLYFFYM
jgi:hypothetical protein